METTCATSHENIFKDHFKRKYIYPLMVGISITYFKYIDDIFLIWTGKKNELDLISKRITPPPHPPIHNICLQNLEKTH